MAGVVVEGVGGGLAPAVVVVVVVAGALVPAGGLAACCEGDEGASVGEEDVPRSSPATLPTRELNAPKPEPKPENGDGVGGGDFDRAALADAVNDG